MNKEELLKKLKLTPNWSSNEKDIYTTYDGDEYARVFSALDTEEELLEDLEAQEMNLFNSKFVFYNDEIEITLEADFEKDEYTLTIKDI